MADKLHPNNLPLQTTSFIGREREMAEVKRLLTTTSLLTLIGAGGAGKTRLSLEVAADLLASYPDGCWFVELAPIRDPSLVPQIVASTIGAGEEAGRSVQDTLLDYLQDKQLLLVLDNCEHLRTAAEQLVMTIIEHCPQVTILASSREHLDVNGEIIWRVPSLPTPHANYSEPLVQLQQYEAVRLITDRITAVRPSFRLTEQNAAAVAKICYRLDGIPLAIELVAARARVLTIEQIASQLDNRFQLLTGGSRTLLPRQQTLKALVDWSYDLLSTPEQQLLQGLSVFAGSWSLDAAQYVCGGQGKVQHGVATLLDQLVSKSLVIGENAEDATRYQMLETIRQYAGEKLRGSGGEVAIQQRHLSYYLQMADEAEAKLKGAEQGVWLTRLEQEHDNLRAALRWALGQQPEEALRITGALVRFWQYHGHLNEGLGWLAAALSTAPHAEPRWRAKVLTGAGNILWWQGDYAGARTNHQQALALRQESGDRASIANSLINLGNLASSEGNQEASAALYEQSLVILRELDDKWSIAQVLNNLGNVANARRDLASARSFYEQALVINRALGDKWAMGITLDNLGALSLAMKDYAAARAIHKESLQLFDELEGKHGIAYELVGLGKVAISQSGEQEAARAVLLLSAGVALFATINVALEPEFRVEYEQALANCRALLDPIRFAALQREGIAMPLQQVIAYALDESLMVAVPK